MNNKGNSSCQFVCADEMLRVQQLMILRAAGRDVCVRLRERRVRLDCSLARVLVVSVWEMSIYLCIQRRRGRLQFQRGGARRNVMQMKIVG